MLEPHCRALLSQKSSMQSSPALQLWLKSGRSPALLLQPSWGDRAPLALGHRLSSRLGREMGAQGVTRCRVLGLCHLVHRADRSYSVPLRSSMRRQLCCGAGWTWMHDTSRLGCLPPPFTAEQQEAPLAASQGQRAPLGSVPPAPAGSRAPGCPGCCAPRVRQGQPAPGEPCPQLFYIPSALVSVTVQITCFNKPTSPILQGAVIFLLQQHTRVCLGEPTATKPPAERTGLEEPRPTGKKRNEEKGQRVCTRPGQKRWQQDRGGSALPPGSCKLLLVQTG